MIKTLLFDLDGTLLPMEQEKFVKAYFGGIAAKATKYGYEPNQLINMILKGTNLMLTNDGKKTNEEVFWDYFVKIYGEESLKDKFIFDEFYEKEFQEVAKVCGYNELAKDVIEFAKEKGYRLILATNPIFPNIATESRIRWAGLSPNDFEIYTTYEKYSYCKPNLEYYSDILKRINCNANECLMIGNDVDEDMIVSDLGMKTFLLTDCLINKNNKDISMYKKGSFVDLLSYLKNNLN